MQPGALQAEYNGYCSSGFILNVAAKGFGVDLLTLVGESRVRPLVQYRQITMYAVRLVAELSYPAIGSLFGRDHTTVMHACRQVAANPRMRSTAARLITEVREQWAIDHGASLFDPGEDE